MVNLIRVCLISIVLVTPLLQANYFFGFEQIKVYFFTVLMIITTAIFVIYSRHIEKVSFKVDLFEIIAFVFVILLFITAYSGINPKGSIFGLPSYYQGAILYLLLFLFYIFIRIVKLSKKTFGFALLLSSTTVAFEAIFEWILLHVLDMPIPTYNGRVISTFGQPNLYSGFVLLTIPFYLDFLRNSPRRMTIVIGSGFFLSIIAILVSQSRASIILLFLLLGFYLLRFARIKNFILLLTVFLALGIVLMLVFLPGFIKKEILDPLNNKWVSSNAPEKRILIWEVAVTQALKKPIFGYGVDSFGQVYRDYFEQNPKPNDDAYQNRKNIVVTRSHNYTLDLMVFSGIFGLAAWLLLIFSLIVKPKEEIFTVCIILYALWVQIQIQSVVHLIFFWGTAAMAVSSKFKH